MTLHSSSGVLLIAFIAELGRQFLGSNVDFDRKQWMHLIFVYNGEKECTSAAFAAVM